MNQLDSMNAVIEARIEWALNHCRESIAEREARMYRRTKYWIGFALVLFCLFLAWGVRAEAEVSFVYGMDGERGMIYGDGPVQFSWTQTPDGHIEQGQVYRQEDQATSFWSQPSGTGLITGEQTSGTRFYQRTDGGQGIIVTPTPEQLEQLQWEWQK